MLSEQPNKSMRAHYSPFSTAVLLAALLLSLSAFAADAPIKSAPAQTTALTAIYLPKNNGVETEVTLRYQFKRAFDDFYVLPAASVRKHGDGAYWHKGKRYTAAEIGSDVFTNLKFSLSPSIEVDVYNGSLLVGAVKWANVLSFAGSFAGDSRSLLSSLGIKASDVKAEDLHRWSLQNMRITSGAQDGVDVLPLEHAVQSFESGKIYASKVSQADAHLQARRYPEAIAAYKEAAQAKPDEAYPKLKLEEINALQREAAKAQAQQRARTNSVAESNDDFWDLSKKNSAASGKLPPDRARSPGAARSSGSDDLWYSKPKPGASKPKGPPTFDEMNPAERKTYGEAKAAEVMADIKSRNKLANEPTAPLTRSQIQSNAANAEAVRALRDRWESLKSRQRLGDTEFTDTAQVDAAYYQQLRAINTDAEQIREEAAGRIQSAAQEAFAGDGQYGAAVGGLVGLVGTAINNADVERERREARADLQRERDAQIAQIEARKLALEQRRAQQLADIQQRKVEAEARESELRVQMRRDLLKTFPEGGTPLSSQNIPEDELYFFSYAVKDVATEDSPIFISNVFPIARYSDGAWPYKQSFVGDLSRLAPAEPRLVGFFLSRDQALAARESLLSLSAESGFVIREIEFKGKPSSGRTSNAPRTDSAARNNSDEDLWGLKPRNPKSARETNASPADDDFWGVGPAKPSGTKKAEIWD